MKNKFSMAMSLAVVLAMLLTSLAFADDVVIDGDTVTGGNQSSVNLGTVAPGAVLTPQVSFTLVCDSAKHVDNGQTVSLTFSLAQSAVPAGGSLSATNAAIGAIPGSWPDDASGGSGNCGSTPPAPLNDNGNSTVTITAPTTSGGPYTYKVRYLSSLSPAGDNDSSSIKADHVDVTYTLMVSAPVTDTDSDGVPDSSDNCPSVANTNQANMDGDAFGDACDSNSYAPDVDTAAADATGNEGDTLSTFGTFLDADGNSTLTISFSGAGTGVDKGDGTWSWSLPTDDDGSGSVTVQASDGEHAVATDSFSWSAANVAPTAAITGAPASSPEGTAISLGSSVTDPSSVDTAAGFTYAWNVTKNGNPYAAGSTASFSFTPDDDGSYVVSFSATDKDNDTGSDSKTISVTNVSPNVAVPSWASTSVACRAPATLTGISFSDPGAIDYPWNVNINWSDSSPATSYNTNTQGAQSNQSHTYNTPGTYSATVSVTDKDGDTGSNTSGSLAVLQSYTVNFLQPFDNSSPSQLITNTMKSGRTVPVKVTIYDVCTQAYVTDPSAAVTIFLSTGTTTGGSNDAVEVYADAGASNGNTLSFRWTSDSTAPGGGFWIYNLDSRTVLNGSALAINTTYRVDVFVGAVRATTSKWALLKPVK